MRKILVLDDDSDILEIVNLVLSKQGYIVYPLVDSHEIISTIKDLKPDLLLLDVYHHGVDNTGICTEIKEDNSLKYLPIILFSASSDLKEKYIELGAAGFIEKPFDIYYLLDKIKAYLN